MRMVASEIGSRESRGQVRTGSRTAALRKARLRALALESLESRMLLAVLPPAARDLNAPAPIDVSSFVTGATATTSSESSPTIAIDPALPQKLVSVWTQFNGTNPSVQGAFSTNGGINWTSFIAQPTILADPAGGNFAQVDNASVAFDRNNNFYIVSSEHSATTDQTGAVVIQKFDYSAATPTLRPIGANNTTTLYTWDVRGNSTATTPSGAVISLSLAVDDTVSTFTDGSWTVSNPNTGN